MIQHQGRPVGMMATFLRPMGAPLTLASGDMTTSGQPDADQAHRGQANGDNVSLLTDIAGQPGAIPPATAEADAPEGEDAGGADEIDINGAVANGDDSP